MPVINHRARQTERDQRSERLQQTPYQYTQYASSRSVRSSLAESLPKRRYRGLRILALCVLLVGGYFTFFHSNEQQPVASTVVASKPPAVSEEALAHMGSQIEQIIAAHTDVDVSVSYVDLSTGKARNYGASEVFVAASTAKLLTALTFLEQVEQGKQSLNTSYGDATPRDLLEKMIVESDNPAWEMLTVEVGRPNVAAYAAKLGITDYNQDNNTLTPQDIALVLRKLYAGELINNAHTQLLLDYMQRADDDDFIPKAVPTGVKVYHKAGLLEDRIHDAAIIDDGKRPYVLVIFTHGHGEYNLPERTKLLRDITRATTKAYGY